MFEYTIHLRINSIFIKSLKSYSLLFGGEGPKVTFEVYFGAYSGISKPILLNLGFIEF